MNRAPAVASSVNSVLDLWPFYLIKSAPEGTCDWVWAVVNNCLREGAVPLAHKRPLLNGPSLDPASLGSFLLGSNLPFWRKVVGKVAWQLQMTLDEILFWTGFRNLCFFSSIQGQFQSVLIVCVRARAQLCFLSYSYLPEAAGSDEPMVQGEISIYR